jgi:hypothetical protein
MVVQGIAGAWRANGGAAKKSFVTNHIRLVRILYIGDAI